MEIREANEGDLFSLLELYAQLHDNPIPCMDESLRSLWTSILHNKSQHIVVAAEDGRIVSSCVLTVIPNLTHGQRPYAVIENVITDETHRKKGYATAILNYAKEIAQKENCYKIMLMTGSKKESTMKFYEQAGYNRSDKTAFIRWL